MTEDIFILEGHGDSNRTAKRVFDTHGKSWREFTELYEHPHRIRTIASLDPEYIYIFTTGIRQDELEELTIVFKSTGWIPRNVIFGSEESAMAMLGIARELKKAGTKFYYLGFPDPNSHFKREINWI